MRKRPAMRPSQVYAAAAVAVALVVLAWLLLVDFRLREFQLGRRLYQRHVDMAALEARDPVLRALPDDILASAARHHVLLTGLCRDNAAMLPTTLAALEAMGQAFASYQILILENDSVDGTAELLQQQAARNPRLRVLHLELKRDLPVLYGRSSVKRTQAMAALRNRLVQEIRGQAYQHVDYVIVADLDLVALPSPRAVQAAFRLNFDVACAHGINWHVHLLGGSTHYDDFAFADVIGSRVAGACIACSPVLLPPLQLDPHRTPAILVQSCFGGLAIVRRGVFAACNYTGDDCEHVGFNTCARLHGYDRIFLDPHMVVVR